MRTVKKIILFVMICSGVACKKSKSNSPDPSDSNSYLQRINAQYTPATGTPDEKVVDSLLLYAQQVYLWNTRMPTYEEFQPRKFTSDPEKLMETLKGYSPVSSTNTLLDRYSFLDEGSVSSELSGTNPSSYGLFPLYFTNTDFRIKMVEKNSPADLVGLERGDRILEVNNRSDITFNNGDRPPQFVLDAFSSEGNSLTLKVRKADLSEKTVTISRAEYAINPVLYSSIFTKGNIKIGYISYQIFTSESEAKIKAEIDKFNAAGCSKIIIDLRYNGGGRVSTCIAFGNLISPTNANGKIQYQAEYNELMQNDKAKILGNQFLQATNGNYYPMTTFKELFTKEKNTYRFNKVGSFAPSAIYFLVTKNTASASEMLINMMKPFTEVHIIGSKTYGKPVGFFPVKIGKYDVYYAMSKATNAAGFGDYFEGMEPEKVALDNVTLNWGDEKDDMIKAALTHIETGNYPTSARRATAESLDVERANEVFNKESKTNNLFIDLPKR